MEKLNDSIEKQPNEAEATADDEDEVVEEDEAEGFGKACTTAVQAKFLHFLTSQHLGFESDLV